MICLQTFTVALEASLVGQMFIVQKIFQRIVLHYTSHLKGCIKQICMTLENQNFSDFAKIWTYISEECRELSNVSFVWKFHDQKGRPGQSLQLCHHYISFPKGEGGGAPAIYMGNGGLRWNFATNLSP